MPVFNELKGKNVPIKLWAPVNEIESSALDQCKNIAALPWIFHHVAIMPDCHTGKGAVVGSVVVTKGSLSAACVGVDIGCGVNAVKTSLDLNKVERKLEKVYDRIRETIPVGMNSHTTVVADSSDMDGKIRSECKELFDKFNDLDEHVHSLKSRAGCQLGSLGSGNHFISLAKDSENGLWLMLHSGSRNIGKTLAELHISKAKKLAHNQDLPDRELAAFLSGTPEMEAYRRDLLWAQRYSALNRKVMIRLYKNVLEEFWPGVKYEDEISCHHNYVAEEVHYGEEVFVTRKGAIRAQTGDLGIIPGCMGGSSFIVRGLGNPESFMSASHGAGRKMSRSKAKQHFTRQDLIEQTEGVVCRKDADVIDEIPKSYKDIFKVMNNQSDLVEVVAEIKEIMNVKG